MIYNNNYFKDKNKFVNILNDFIKKQQLIEKHNKNLLKIKNNKLKLQIKDSVINYALNIENIEKKI